MTQGRKPKPTKIKKLEDYRNKKRINIAEPDPPVQIPKCPDYLSADAKEEWNRIGLELEVLGLLTELDRSALMGYCVAYGTFMEAEKVIQAVEGDNKYIVKTKKGNIIQHPALAVRNKAMELMLKYLTEFGMSPSSRTKVSVKVKEPERQKRPALNR